MAIPATTKTLSETSFPQVVVMPPKGFPFVQHEVPVPPLKSFRATENIE